ncbi:MAG: terminase family protein, partial [Methylocella sp.]
MNILEALDDPSLFGPHFRGPSWAAWRAFLTAAFGLPMDDASRELFRQCTGRAAVPAGPISEAALVVGRRGGKSRVLALIAVYLACFRDYGPYLAPGEVATIAVLAANRPQARSIFRYVSGILKAVPLFARMIEDENTESIALANRVLIEIGTASFRTTRGYSFAAVLCDEIAFWRQDETSANPDVEILRALRPGMASIPGSILMLASSPYAKRGELYAAYRRHFGKDDARVLVWKADTATMNPRIDPAIIAEAYDSDLEAARAEYGAEFRDDLGDYITREAVDAVVCWGRSELPPEPGVTYATFCDPSGGVNDAMTLAVVHLRDGAICVLDAVLEVRPPFDPEVAVSACTAVLRRFGVTRVAGDRYAGLWPKARFAEHGIAFEQSARPKSDLYCDLLPLLNAKRVELLDNPRLAAQLVGLERRTARSGRDTVDHTPGGHDDLANV